MPYNKAGIWLSYHTDASTLHSAYACNELYCIVLFSSILLEVTGQNTDNPVLLSLMLGIVAVAVSCYSLESPWSPCSISNIICLLQSFP